MLPNPSDVTQLLAQWRAGDSAAESTLMSAVHPVLKQIAAQRISARDPVVFSVADRSSARDTAEQRCSGSERQSDLEF